MKYARGIAVVLALLSALSCLNAYVFAVEDNVDGQPNTAIVSGCQSLDAASTYLGPKTITENIGTAVVYETNSETLMYSLNPDNKIYPSSLVKILTALIAVEKGNLDDVVTVSQDVVDTVPYYAVSAELVAEEKISLSDLLYCMMVGSANDAAAVIATHISGSQETFVGEMNAYAEKLGCSATQFVNVHGLHDEQQFSTTRDMAKIVAAAINNETFMTYFSAVHYDVPATNKSEVRELSSGNFLMNIDNMDIYYDERVKGGRTGVAEDGLQCLASIATQDSMQLICIVTGSESTYAEDGRTLTYGSFKETTALLDMAFNGYKVVQILHENQVLKQCKIANGTNDVVLGSHTSAYSVLPVDATISELSYRYSDENQLQAPISEGQSLSRVEIWYGNLCVGQAELFSMNTVHPITNQKLDNEGPDGDNGTSKTIVIILVIVGVAFSVLLLVRFSGKIRAFLIRRHNAVHRRNRRRSR